MGFEELFILELCITTPFLNEPSSDSLGCASAPDRFSLGQFRKYLIFYLTRQLQQGRRGATCAVEDAPIPIQLLRTDLAGRVDALGGIAEEESDYRSLARVALVLQLEWFDFMLIQVRKDYGSTFSGFEMTNRLTVWRGPG